MSGCSMLVVDDEKLAREYVMNLLDWSKLGIDQLYEADNCYAALAIIEAHRPEIIVLDIKMPEMSGVELLQVMQQKSIDAEVIFLSGYSDFELARRMLKSGNVVEYLLKPVSEDMAAEAVTRSIARVEKKREMAEIQGLFNKAVENERRRAYRSYIFGYAYEPDEYADLTIQNMSLQIAVVYCEAGTAFKNYCADMITSKLTHLQEFFAYEQPGHYALLFMTDKDDAQQETLRICQNIAEKVDGYCGVGRQYNNVLELNASYRQASFACECRLFVRQRVIHIDEINKSLKSSIDGDETIRKMAEYLRTGDTGGIDELLKQIMRSLLFETDDGENPYDLGIAKAYFANFLESVMPERKSSINLSYLFSAKNLGALFSILKNTLHQSCEYYSEDRSIHKKNLIKQVKHFIHTNYMNQITLNDAADIVFINPSYLSRLFSEVEGCGFSCYVAKTRVDEAKKLLGDRKYKIYEIAEAVGYKSFKYFLKVFKEKEGITPAQYREKKIFS